MTEERKPPKGGYPYYPPWPMMPQPYPYGYPPMAFTPEDELRMLESYRDMLEAEREMLEREIASVEERIRELQGMLEEGAPTPPQPPYPAWGPPFFWTPPTMTPEQERMMLEQQAEALERQIEAIKKRLEELRKGES